jgi:hypothetical protein
MFAHQQFKRPTAVPAHLLGTALQNHALISQGCARGSQRVTALDLNHADIAGGRRLDPLKAAERRYRDTRACCHLKKGLARFKRKDNVVNG